MRKLNIKVKPTSLRFSTVPTDCSLNTYHAFRALLEARAKHLDSVLTRRQMTIVVEISAGFANGQIARKLAISDATLNEHIRTIKDRMMVEDRVTIGIIGFLWLERRSIEQLSLDHSSA